MKIDFDNNEIETPCYIIDEKLLRKNLQILKDVKDKSGAKILLATKAFSMFSTFKIVAEYLDGVTSSSLFEARLGHEEMGKEVHIYSPAYLEKDFDDILKYSDHIVFNTIKQINKFLPKIRQIEATENKKIQIGIRVNPEYSEIETDIYNPCFENSRMGTTLSNFEEDIENDNCEIIKNIDGLHFHTMCEQGADTLKRTLEVVEEKFGKYLYNMKWLNFGGGHHITKEEYNIETLIECISYMKNKYDLDIYLEPGEAIALNTGFLVSTVLETMKNNMDIAILDTSATCHMPDVLEMPYRPFIINSEVANKLPYTYRLGCPTCLSGDVIGDYSFNKLLKEGDKLIFCDMAIYSMVKNNTFNGINLPSIYFRNLDEKIELVKSFGYEDFKNRLS